MAKKKTVDKQSDMLASAMKLFWDGKYEKARKAFEKIVAEFGEEMHFVERIESYLTICERQIDGDEIKPRGADEQYVAGLYYINNGDLIEGISWLKKAAKKEEGRDARLYTLACAHALAGDEEEALATLSEAVKLNPDNGYYALNNPDFESIASSQGFKDLIS